MSPVLLLSAPLLDQLLPVLPLMDAVEAAFRDRGRGVTQPGGVLSVPASAGGFHLKVAALGPETGLLAAKLNGNFPGNPETNGLPTIQGLVLVADVATGEPLAVLESGALTRLRTAAASGVAIRHLARPEATRLTLIGCGAQGFDQVRFAHAVRPLRQVTLFDARPAAAQQLARRLAQELGLTAAIGEDLAAACRESDIIITCTTSTVPVLLESMVPAGALVVAAGADHAHKQEIESSLLARSRVVTDVTPQCAEIGELHHALAKGVMVLADVHAELGEVLAGGRVGRMSPTDRMLFDSTGTPIQDAAAVQVAVAEARARGLGTWFDFTR